MKLEEFYKIKDELTPKQLKVLNLAIELNHKGENISFSDVFPKIYSYKPNAKTSLERLSAFGLIKPVAGGFGICYKIE